MRNPTQLVSQIGGLVFVGFSLFVIFQARKLNYYTALGPGPGFFPLWLGSLLLLFSLVYLFQTWRNFQPLAEDFFPNRSGALRLGLVVAAIIGFALGVEVLGFQLMMFAFLLLMLTTLGRQNPWLTLALCVAGSWGLFRLFRGVLHVQLPTSSLEFLKNLGL